MLQEICLQIWTFFFIILEILIAVLWTFKDTYFIEKKVSENVTGNTIKTVVDIRCKYYNCLLIARSDNHGSC